jgi:nitrate/TMAO reductase-like tetraheme cytochrome c subunit
MIAMTLLGTLRDALAGPSPNPTVAFALLALLTIAVLLALVLLLLAFTRPVPTDRDDTLEDADERAGAQPTQADADDYEYPELVSGGTASRIAEPEEGNGYGGGGGRRRRRIAGTWVAVAVAATLLAVSFAATSTDRYCTGACHAHQAAVQAHARDTHVGVACVTCHEDASIAGAFGAPFARTGHVLRRVVSGLGSRMAPVSSGSCLGCHSGIRGRTVSVTALDIRMSHDAPLAAGMSCADCHTGTGHDSGAPAAPGMTTCAPCHDGETAASSCTTCHPADASRARRPSDARRVYATVKLDPMTECGACHDQTACDACHGMRLPHTAEFKAWSHARAASFDGRKACQRCHTTSDCTKCHPEVAVGTAAPHPADWKTSHQSQPGNSACECHWRRLPDAGRSRGTYCLVCH